jgi:hypothetical protein
MKLKSLFVALTLVLSIVFMIPQTALAVYYNTQGEPLLPNGQPQKVTPPVVAPVGIPVKRRKDLTNEYEYIIQNNCDVLAVNLYLGETLYSCPSGAKFWSDVSIHPTQLELMAKNRKKVRDEETEIAIDAAIVSSVTTQMMMR